MDDEKLNADSEELDMDGGLIDEAEIPEDAFIDEEAEAEAEDLDEGVIEDLEEEYITTAPDEAPARPRRVTSKTRRDNPYDITEEELEFIFQKRRTLNELEGRERTRHYGERQAVGYFGDTDADSFKRKEREEAQRLIAAVRAPRPQILSGTVAGFSRTENEKMMLVNIDLENGTGINQVKIPATQFCFFNINEYSGNELNNRHLESLITAHFGAKVHFIVFEYNEKEHIAYASRLAAMDMISNIYFVRPDRRKEKVSRPRVYEGVTAVANVIATFRDRIIVDICGTDVTMKKEHLSWTSVGRLDNEFMVGDSFRVRIKSIGKPEKLKYGTKTYTKIPVEASKRELEPKPQDIFFDHFKVGDCVQGIIKSETNARGLFVRISGKMDCFCPPLPVPVQYNSTCIVRITGKYPEDKRIAGTILVNTVRPPRPEY